MTQGLVMDAGNLQCLLGRHRNPLSHLICANLQCWHKRMVDWYEIPTADLFSGQMKGVLAKSLLATACNNLGSLFTRKRTYMKQCSPLLEVGSATRLKNYPFASFRGLCIRQVLKYHQWPSVWKERLGNGKCARAWVNGTPSKFDGQNTCSYPLVI